ncbi:MAG TPA: hypothetical protein DCQ98_07075 [Planctomycetaceae bacterium]|nr:hypothetical protein [Planctomycetaceae bacterium]
MAPIRFVERALTIHRGSVRRRFAAVETEDSVRDESLPLNRSGWRNGEGCEWRGARIRSNFGCALPVGR